MKITAETTKTKYYDENKGEVILFRTGPIFKETLRKPKKSRIEQCSHDYDKQKQIAKEKGNGHRVTIKIISARWGFTEKQLIQWRKKNL